MYKLRILIIFLIINFGALGVGGLLMNNGPMTEWYINLNKAPWTPPGWVFGVAWTTIMICFSIYMMYLYIKEDSTKVKTLFLIQLVLNISWNYVFFNQHLIGLGLVIITLLTILTFYFLLNYSKKMSLKSFLILPYSIWLCIATSLNAFILIYN